MKLEIKEQTAKDLIEFINSLKGLKFNKTVNYTSKKTGVQTKFSYVTLDKILAKVKENKNFSLLTPLGRTEDGHPSIQVILVHKSGEVISSDCYKIQNIENVSKQDEGSAITYTKRYAIGSFLGISTEEDKDGKLEEDPMFGMPITQGQIDMIEDKIVEINYDLNNLLSKFGKKDIRDLSFGEGEKILERVNSVITKNKKVEKEVF